MIDPPARLGMRSDMINTSNNNGSRPPRGPSLFNRMNRPPNEPPAPLATRLGSAASGANALPATRGDNQGPLQPAVPTKRNPGESSTDPVSVSVHALGVRAHALSPDFPGAETRKDQPQLL